MSVLYLSVSVYTGTTMEISACILCVIFIFNVLYFVFICYVYLFNVLHFILNKINQSETPVSVRLVWLTQQKT